VVVELSHNDTRAFWWGWRKGGSGGMVVKHVIHFADLSSTSAPMPSGIDTTSMASTAPMSPKASSIFPFLDLPKDLRLMIYDHFVTRSHHDISWTQEKETATMTLVTPNPISPLHLTCKALHAEVTPFLKAKIARMSLPRATPRLILYPQALRALFLH
jgi:hypothetical protein